MTWMAAAIAGLMEAELPGSDKDFDTPGRFSQALGLSLACHGLLLVALIFGGIRDDRQVIQPGDVIFVTPVSPPPASSHPEPAAPPPEEPPPPPPPPAMEEPRVKKAALAPVKKFEEPKILPKGEKIKPPEPSKPTPPPPPPPRPKPATGQAQSFRAEGGEVFKYDYYVKIVKRKVEENWITHGVSAEGQSGYPEVYFRIFRDGSLGDIRLEKSSGSPELDQSALDAVKNVTMPPLPAGYKQDYLGVYYDFQYEQRR